jgi:hypothetical protein
MSKYKTCSRCKHSQALESFRNTKQSLDGKTYYCKTCLNREYQEYRKRVPRVLSEESKAKNRMRSSQIPVEIRAKKQAAWYEKNKQKVLDSSRAYHAKNPGARVNQINAYRTRKLNNGVFLVTHLEIQKLRMKPCYYCGVKKSGTIDHVMPISLGGRHSIGNIVPACKFCNSKKQSKLLIVWRIQKGEFEK